MEVKIAISQRPPVLLDLEATYQCALDAVAEAAANGAQLIVFPEAFLPGYPTWVWRLRPGGDMDLGNTIHATLQKNSVDLAAGGLDRLRAAAAKHGVIVVMGLHEVDSAFTHSTLFNTVVVMMERFSTSTGS